MAATRQLTEYVDEGKHEIVYYCYRLNIIILRSGLRNDRIIMTSEILSLSLGQPGHLTDLRLAAFNLSMCHFLRFMVIKHWLRLYVVYHLTSIVLTSSNEIKLVRFLVYAFSVLVEVKNKHVVLVH